METLSGKAYDKENAQPLVENDKKSINSLTIDDARKRSHISPSILKRINKSSECYEDSERSGSVVIESSHATNVDTPVSSAFNMPLGSDADPVTPSLEHWKFSESTRSLFGASSFRCASPVTPRLPQTATTLLEIPHYSDSFLSSQPAPSYINTKEEEPKTPVAVVPTRSLDIPSPATPTLQTSPLRTCGIQIPYTKVGEEASKPTELYARFEDDSGDEIDILNILSEFKPTTPLKKSSSHTSRAYEDVVDSDPVFGELSPLKVCKVLMPSKRVIEDGQGWIPEITSAEYAQAPVFLRLQLPLPVLNAAIGSLNVFISQDHAPKNSKRLESFSDEEIEEVVGNKGTHGCGVSSKVIVLGLVSLNRLDFTTEHSVKVYRVRRFY